MNATTFDQHPKLGTDYWADHDQFPLADWQQQVQDKNTRLGYWDWVLAQIETAQDVKGNTSDQGKLINLAFEEVQRVFPAVTTVTFDEHGRWVYLTDSDEAPSFDNTNIDMDLLDDASNSVLDLPATFKAAV